MDRNSDALIMSMSSGTGKHFLTVWMFIISCCWCDCSGQLVSRDDVVVSLQSFCSDRDVDPFKRIAVLQTLEQVSSYFSRHL